jgi:hypothetical protein
VSDRYAVRFAVVSSYIMKTRGTGVG